MLLDFASEVLYLFGYYFSKFVANLVFDFLFVQLGVIVFGWLVFVESVSVFGDILYFVLQILQFLFVLFVVFSDLLELVCFES